MTASAQPTSLATSRPWAWPRAISMLLLLGLPLLLTVTGVEHLGMRLAVLLIVGWAVPGLLLARIWGVTPWGAPAHYLAAWGLGFCWLMLGALIAHYLPGPLLAWQLWGFYALGGVGLVLWAEPDPAETTESSQPVDRSVWMAGGVLLLAAVLLRLPGLGYHEFHTDEVVLIRQAGLSIGGYLPALAEHTKGPGEITVVLAVYRALNAIDETTARFPFALMSVGSALATGWLGLRLGRGTLGAGMGVAVGLWAGLLLLSNGFALGLSRIAQYQPGILLLSALAVWAMWEFAQSGRPRWLSLAGVFSAFGMVLHYEFGLLAPALLLLLAWGAAHQKPRALVQTGALTAGLGALLLAVAYVPPLFNPYFSTTQSYLSNRLGETLVFNWPFFVEMGTFYNSTYFFFGLMALAGLGSWLGLRARQPPEQSPARAIWLLTAWWLPFFVLYIFVVRFPGTHFYQMMTAWSLLAAFPLAMLSRAVFKLWRPNRTQTPTTRQPAWLLLLAASGVAAWLAISVFYLHLLFFRQNPEYLVNQPREYVPLYWAPYAIPQKPRFGFPIQAGWKTIGVLGEWGYLTGTYTSNDRSWGLRNWYRDHLVWIEDMYAGESPDYVLSAVHIQEENLAYHDAYHATYLRIGEVRLRGEPRIALWAREPLPVPYVTFDAEDFDALFLDEYARLPHQPSAADRLLVAPPDGHLDAAVELVAAEVPAGAWPRGEVVHLALTWQARAPLAQDYKLFVHVADAQGQPLAQWDGYPGLNTSRTTSWAVDAPFVDHVLLPLPAEMPAGDYTLLAGLYDPETGARLGERALTITQLTVQ